MRRERSHPKGCIPIAVVDETAGRSRASDASAWQLPTDGVMTNAASNPNNWCVSPPRLRGMQYAQLLGLLAAFVMTPSVEQLPRAGIRGA